MKVKKKFDFKSIKFRVWISFIVFAVIIIALLWISQVIFLSYYTDRYKKSEFTQISDKLKENYYGDYERTYSTLANKHGCMVEVITLGEDNLVEFSTNGLGFGSSGQKVRNTNGLKKILDALDDDQPYFYKDSAQSAYTFARYLNDEKTAVLVLSQSTQVADSTVSILQTQMWIATITIIVLAFCISLIMSETLSKDISLLSSSAKKFANSDYSVLFPEKGATEIAEISATLNYAVKEVSKVEELRRELISNVSHDLRTPLTLIKGYAELIRDISGEDKQTRDEHLEIIIKETDRLTRLVSDMLSLAKMQSGETEMEVERLSLTDLVKDAAQSFMVLNQKDGFNITCQAEEGLFVKGDITRLQVATYNLIGNAVNYTGEDKKVEIKLQKKDDRAVFSVTDSGEGIDSETKNLIWQRYYRAKEHKRSITGSGLGLSIVKKVLEAHNAQFDVDSVVGEGSTFWYSLELDNEEEVEQ